LAQATLAQALLAPEVFFRSSHFGLELLVVFEEEHLT